jgi:biopolymer transport protein ExbD
MNFFKNIKGNKTDNQKNIISLVLAVLLTLIIVFVWSPFKNNRSKEVSIDSETEESRLSSISPIAVIKEEFSRMWSVFEGHDTFVPKEDEVTIEFLEIASSSETSLEELETITKIGI